jgi:hypothetical protein
MKKLLLLAPVMFALFGCRYQTSTLDDKPMIPFSWHSAHVTFLNGAMYLDNGAILGTQLCTSCIPDNTSGILYVSTPEYVYADGSVIFQKYVQDKYFRFPKSWGEGKVVMSAKEYVIH